MECDGSGPGQLGGDICPGSAPSNISAVGEGQSYPRLSDPHSSLSTGEGLHSSPDFPLQPHSAHTHTHGQLGVRLSRKKGSFCAPSCQARSRDPFSLILAAWTEKVPASRALAESVFNQPLQLPEQELNVQCICQSLLTSFFFL